ncbi:MAG: type II secretion system protein [Planctomycetes bacterium]|nr:type II secretion system protein [Planctomycetota bacterium]
MRTNTKSSGFSLVELLIVMAIITMLVSIGLPVYVKAKTGAYTLKCVANMKAIGSSLTSYRTMYEGWMPYISETHGAQERNKPYADADAAVKWKYELSALAGSYSGTSRSKDDLILSEIFFDPVRVRSGGRGNYFLSKRHFGAKVMQWQWISSSMTYGWTLQRTYYSVAKNRRGGSQNEIRDKEVKGHMEFRSWSEPSRAAILGPSKSPTLQRGLGKSDNSDNNVNIEYRHAGVANILFLDEHVEQFRKGDDSLWEVFDKKFDLRVGPKQYYLFKTRDGAEPSTTNARAIQYEE